MILNGSRHLTSCHLAISLDRASRNEYSFRWTPLRSWVLRLETIQRYTEAIKSLKVMKWQMNFCPFCYKCALLLRCLSVTRNVNPNFNKSNQKRNNNKRSKSPKPISGNKLAYKMSKLANNYLIYQHLPRFVLCTVWQSRTNSTNNLTKLHL